MRLASALLAGVLILTPSSSAHSTVDPDETWSLADDSKNALVAGRHGDARASESAHTAAGSSDDGPQDKYIRADETSCFLLKNTEYVHDVTHTPGACPENRTAIEQDLDCEDGTYALAPLWVQRLNDDGTYADAEKVADGQCVTPADVMAEARREFKSMKIATPEATVQGNLPMVVNVHYPAYTTATAQSRQVTLLGVPVVIRADPTEFTWDFDDPYSAGGSTLTTTSPGRQWHEGDATPDQSWVGHTYSRLGSPGQDAGTDVDDNGNVYRTDVTVTLSTTWQGRFRVQGTSTWTDIPGTISTTSTAGPATVTEARTRLVCDDVDGSTVC